MTSEEPRTPGGDAAGLLWEALLAARARVYDRDGHELRFDELSGALCRVGAAPPDGRRTGAVRLHDRDRGTPLAPGSLPAERALRGEVVDRLEVIAVDPEERKRTTQLVNARPIQSDAGEVVAAVVWSVELPNPAGDGERSGDQRELLDPQGLVRGVEQELERASATAAATSVAMMRPSAIRSVLGPVDPLPPSSADDVAEHWLEISRATDLLGAWRPGEFGLVLANCGSEQGVRVLRRFVERLPRGHGTAIGLTQWDGSEPAAELIDRAERALDEALRLGGGRIFVPEYAVLAA